MTLTFSRLRAHFGNWRQWELNPVVVKELRQSVRSWAVIGMLLLFLSVMFCTALSYLVGQSFQTEEERQLGGRVFAAFIKILTGASLVFIPLYVGIRLAFERQESNLDLLYVTTLTPREIIRGKFLCGAYMAVLFFSACMPFMVFTNLLRGVDLPTIFFILCVLFIVICSAIEGAIFVACLPISKLFKILVALAGAIFMFNIARQLTNTFIEIMSMGVGSMMVARNFWGAILTLLLIVLMLVVLLHFLSVAMISPLSANRALPLRSYLTAIWILSGLVTFYWARNQHTFYPILPWAVISFILLTAAMLIVICNHDELSLRVRRQIPARPGLRALAFLFYNGAAGGLVWVALLMGGTFAIASLTMRELAKGTTSYFGSSNEILFDFDHFAPAALMYAMGYALAALFLHRRFMPKRSPKVAGILAILLPSAWALVPYIASFFLNRLSWRSLEQGQLGNIFNIFVVRDEAQKNAHVNCAGVFLLFMVLINLKWFARQIQSFRPLERKPSPAVPATAPPPASTAGQVNP